MDNSTQTGGDVDIISNSAASCYSSCPRQYQFEHVKRRLPLRTAMPLMIGSVFHAGTEAIHQGKRWEPVVESAVLEYGLEDAYEQAKIEAMLIVYQSRYTDDDIEFLEIEKRVDAPLVNPETGRSSRTWRFAGRMDGLVMMTARRASATRRVKLIFETKTTSSDISPGSDWWSNQFMRPQGQLYMAALRHGDVEHSDVEGIIYNAVRKPTIAPRLATPVEKRKFRKDGTLYANMRTEDESPAQYKSRCVQQLMDDPEKFFQRQTIMVDDTSDAEFDLWSVAKNISASKRLNIFPKNASNCFKWNKPCAYFQVCSGNAGIDDPTLFRQGKPRY